MMSQPNATHTETIKTLMGKKSYQLSKAQALAEIGMKETAQPLFLAAASLEERISALLDIEGRELEAAVHRISAASNYKQAGHLSHAVNLYRAALSGPLAEQTQTDVLAMLDECLTAFAQQSTSQAESLLSPELLAAL